MSSTEAEGYALGSGACGGLFICVVAKELGIELKLALHSDSTPTISQHTKMGLGRMKDVELRFLFVKDVLKRQRLTLCTTPGIENPADLRTKVLDVNTHRYLCSIIGSLESRLWRRRPKVRRETRNLLEVLGLNMWKFLGTLGLGLAQRAQDNSTSMNVHEF